MIFAKSIFLLTLLFFFSSCAEEKNKADTTSKNNGYTPLKDRLNRQEGYYQDKEGNWKIRSDKRSAFDNVKNQTMGANQGYAKKEFKAQNFNGTNTSVWADKSYDKKSYNGNTDGSRFMTSSSYQQQSAREGTQTSRETGKTYATNQLDKKTSREASQANYQTTQSADSDKTPDFSAPIMDYWQAKRQLGVEQTKSMMSR